MSVNPWRLDTRVASALSSWCCTNDTTANFYSMNGIPRCSKGQLRVPYDDLRKFFSNMREFGGEKWQPGFMCERPVPGHALRPFCDFDIIASSGHDILTTKTQRAIAVAAATFIARQLSSEKAVFVVCDDGGPPRKVAGGFKRGFHLRPWDVTTTVAPVRFRRVLSQLAGHLAREFEHLGPQSWDRVVDSQPVITGLRMLGHKKRGISNARTRAPYNARYLVDGKTGVCAEVPTTDLVTMWYRTTLHTGQRVASTTDSNGTTIAALRETFQVAVQSVPWLRSACVSRVYCARVGCLYYVDVKKDCTRCLNRFLKRGDYAHASSTNYVTFKVGQCHDGSRPGMSVSCRSPACRGWHTIWFPVTAPGVLKILDGDPSSLKKFKRKRNAGTEDRGRDLV